MEFLEIAGGASHSYFVPSFVIMNSILFEYTLSVSSPVGSIIDEL